MTWLTQNLSTIIVSVLLLTMMGGIVYKMIRDKKSGKSSCGGCSGCDSATCDSKH